MAETPPPPPQPEAEQTVVVNNWCKPELSSDKIKEVISALTVGCLWEEKWPILRCGIFKEVGLRFSVTRQTLHRIWKQAKGSHEYPKFKAFRASPRKKGNSGRPRLYDPEELRVAVALRSGTGYADVDAIQANATWKRGGRNQTVVIRGP
jgi:hypothetical protein